MYALNRAQIIGHLTEDPQVRQTPSGQTVGDLNIVTKQVFTNAAGQAQSTTAYHTVVVWRGLADIAQRFVKKGSQVYVSGRVETDEWEDQSTGQKRYKTRITADDMILLDSRTPQEALPDSSLLGGSLNQCEVIGNLTRDPELRQTPNGTQVASFGVATNFSWQDRSGQKQERTEFHNVVAWGALAQEAARVLKKGRKAYVRGRLQTRSWETPDGNKRYTTELIADHATLLGSPNPDLGAPQAMAAAAPVSSAAPAMATPAAPSNPFAPPSQPAAASPVAQPSAQVPPVNYESEIKPEDLPF